MVEILSFETQKWPNNSTCCYLGRMKSHFLDHRDTSVNFKQRGPRIFPPKGVVGGSVGLAVENGLYRGTQINNFFNSPNQEISIENCCPSKRYIISIQIWRQGYKTITAHDWMQSVSLTSKKKVNRRVRQTCHSPINTPFLILLFISSIIWIKTLVEVQ